MASRIVAIAGGTGKLGRAIVERIVASDNFKVFVLAREASETKSKELGADVLAIDYASVDSIVEVLEEHKVDTLISTLSSMSGQDPEMALIQAADKSKSTKRYIPSTWGMRYTAEVAKNFPLAETKIGYVASLDATSLEYTAVINGYFVDYWVVPHVKSYLGGPALAIDIANEVAAIPGSGNVPIVFTYSFDIGDFVAALLAQSSWEKESYIIGDKVTFNEFLAIAEEARGAKFEVSYDSLETLKNSQITELPSHAEVYPYFPKPMLQGFFASFGILFEEGYFNIQPKKSLNDQFPGIKTRKVKDLVNEAWKGQ